MGAYWLRHLDVIFCSLYPTKQLQKLENIAKRLLLQEHLPSCCVVVLEVIQQSCLIFYLISIL